MISLSVAICTYNREDYLEECLTSLASQEGVSDKFDVIVVDNASTDATKKIIQDKCDNDTRFRYIYEPIQGLARARNTALAATQAPIIAYTDDDAVVPTNWVQKYISAFESQSLQVAVIGGEIDAIFEDERPSWLTDELLRPLSAALMWSKTPRFLNKREWLCEVNCAFRTDILRRYGGFPEQLGRRGDLLLSGENFVNDVMRHDGFLEFFDPSIRVKHHIHKSRLTKEWFRRRYFWQGVTSATIPNVAKSEYNQSRQHWEALTVPMSPAEWLAILSNDSNDEEFPQICRKISELGYLLAFSRLISGR